MINDFKKIFHYFHTGLYKGKHKFIEIVRINKWDDDIGGDITAKYEVSCPTCEKKSIVYKNFLFDSENGIKRMEEVEQILFRNGRDCNLRKTTFNEAFIKAINFKGDN